ncbi:unnamed protein product [Diamesa serratosioi]
MGVRGLTTYIAQHAEKYLVPYELHDCDLVIDGDNLCSTLYRSSDNGLSAFGGNYDHYFRAVVEYFGMLKQCNITPYVLLDGGYEMKKMKTTKERLRGRIGVIKYIIPLEKYMALPLHMREVFVDAVKSCNVKVYRCMFEADNEIAILARKLNCPVLSYDSDFYIFNGLYIPSVTVTPTVYKKTINSSKSFEVEILTKKPKGQKNFKKKNKKIFVETEEVEGEDVVELAESDMKTYNYLDCCIYTIENLTDGVLETDMLPLFAIMLGNDFISKKLFAKFFNSVSRKKTKGKKNMSPQQKKIRLLLNWLQHETLKSAIRKILDKMKHYQRTKLLNQIKNAMKGYRMEYSRAYHYFGFKEEINEDEEDEFDLEALLAEPDDEDEDVANSGEELEEGDEDEEQDEEEDDEEVAGTEEPEETLSGEDEPSKLPARFRKKFVFPEWFKDIYWSAATPRFLVDVICCRRYINYPQVEVFTEPDSNTISYPILYQLYSLLHSPEIPPLYYYTRAPKQIRYQIQRIDGAAFPIAKNYDPLEKKNLKFLKELFDNEFKNSDNIFELIKLIPEAHQLYILAVIYWIQKSATTNSIFLQTVLVGLIALNLVDKKCEKIHREPAKFQKNYSKHLQTLKLLEKVPAEVVPDNTPVLKTLMKNVSKNDALLTMENMIIHYSISSKFERKHADFRKNIVHTFAELQSVVYNLFSLVPFLNYPFQNIKMENYFNGLFLYNIYISLKSRSNSLDYIRGYIFHQSPTLLSIFSEFYRICLLSLPDLKEVPGTLLELPKKVKKVKTIKKILKKPPPLKNDCKDDNSEDDGFQDLNNKFSQLMKNI